MVGIGFAKIKQSGKNPRKEFNDASIAELAQSIKNDGLLQNLVVLKPKGKKKAYIIISGERRFRALISLAEQGDLPKDYQVPVEVREGLNDNDILRLATVENLQREDMHPLDEASAIALLLQNGDTVENVVSKTGLSRGVIQRRLVLSNLCDAVKTALRADEINLSQAEALTLGSVEQQEELITQGLDGHSKSDITEHLTVDKPNVAIAIFPLEYYEGTYTSDLFGTDEETFFDDAEQFLKLQENEIKIRATTYAEQGYAPVEVLEGYDYQSWQYHKTEEGEKGGVVIQTYSNGRVQFHEGIVNHQLQQGVIEETAEQPFVEKKKPTYLRPIMEYMAMHKSIAVQSALLSNPRKAKEVAVVQLLGCSDYGTRISRNEHKCVSYFEDSELQNTQLDIILSQEKIILDLLGAEKFDFFWKNAADVYARVKSLCDDDLDKIHLFLTTLCFGQGNIDALDTNESSLFNLVAQDLEIDMTRVWYADEAFLSKRNKVQLSAIVDATECKTMFGTVSNWKKGDLVKKLAEHFKRIFVTGAETPEEVIARGWLPEAMNFPAIDPDKQIQE